MIVEVVYEKELKKEEKEKDGRKKLQGDKTKERKDDVPCETQKGKGVFQN